MRAAFALARGARTFIPPNDASYIPQLSVVVAELWACVGQARLAPAARLALKLAGWTGKFLRLSLVRDPVCAVSA